MEINVLLDSGEFACLEYGIAGKPNKLFYDDLPEQHISNDLAKAFVRKSIIRMKYKLEDLKKAEKFFKNGGKWA